MLGMDVLRRGISERLVFVVDAGGSRDGGGGKLGHLARPLWGQGEGVVEGTKCHCWIVGGGKLQMEPGKSTRSVEQKRGMDGSKEEEEDCWYLKPGKKRKGRAARILKFWFGVTASFPNLDCVAMPLLFCFLDRATLGHII